MRLDTSTFNFKTNAYTERISYIHLFQLISKLERTGERNKNLVQLDSREDAAARQIEQRAFGNPQTMGRLCFTGRRRHRLFLRFEASDFEKLS